MTADLRVSAGIVAVAAAAAGATLIGGAALAAQVRLIETGSTLLYPLFNLWVTDYQQIHPDVQITTQATGSGTGIAQALSGTAQIGTSDAYMSGFEVRANPGILNVPLAISSQMINYNIPGLATQHLKLNGPLLAGIYEGKVRYWDNPMLVKLNPGVNLPHNAIVPVHRTDGSGDTFIFTQYLAFSTPEWANAMDYGTTVNWPTVPGALGAEGNSGMVSAARETPYSIAYTGISFKDATDRGGLGEADLQNKNGQFVLPDDGTVGAAVKEMAPKTPPDARISLIFAPGPQSYPIVNYEYAIVNSRQPSAEIAKALKDFLSWTIRSKGGSAARYMQAVRFVALPKAIATLSQSLIDSIH